jgi:phosphoadenosine phosphosulfate reductase
MDLNHKIELAIKLLQSIPQDGPIELSYSGGKDSDVILELAKMSGIPFEAIYKNTTIDPPGTISHCKQNGVTILNPPMTFLQIVEKKGTPSRFARFCCEILKEYKVYDRAIQGIRRCESVARAKRYKEPEMCRVYNKKEKARIYFPILEWTDADVAQFIKDRNIKCAPVYYDENGQFNVERRLGCIGCPLQYKNGLRDFEQYPKLFRQIVKAKQKFYDTHPNVGKVFGRNVYNSFYYKFFCKNMDEYRTAVTGGLFPDQAIDTKKFLEEYFGCEL